MIKFLLVKDAPKDTILPRRSTAGSAGYDFFSPVDCVIPVGGCSGLISLNVKIIMPRRLCLQLRSRSGMAVKHGVVLECGGLIDSDYANNLYNDGNIGIKLRNNGIKPYRIHKGDRICQGVIEAYYCTDDDIAEEERRGGYGSTGQR